MYEARVSGTVPRTRAMLLQAIRKYPYLVTVHFRKQLQCEPATGYEGLIQKAPEGTYDVWNETDSTKDGFYDIQIIWNGWELLAG